MNPDTLSLLSDLIGIGSFAASAVAALAALRTRADIAHERARQEEEIRVILRIGAEGHAIRLPLALRRAELSRAELLGRIGMLPMREAGRRFSLSALASPEFLRQINEVRSGSSREIVIPATEAEIQQFAL